MLQRKARRVRVVWSEKMVVPLLLYGWRGSKELTAGMVQVQGAGSIFRCSPEESR